MAVVLDKASLESLTAPRRLDCIEKLIAVLNDYIECDEACAGFDSGCFGKEAEHNVLKLMHTHRVPVTAYIKVSS